MGRVYGVVNVTLAMFESGNVVPSNCADESVARTVRLRRFSRPWRVTSSMQMFRNLLELARMGLFQRKEFDVQRCHAISAPIWFFKP